MQIQNEAFLQKRVKATVERILSEINKDIEPLYLMPHFYEIGALYREVFPHAVKHSKPLPDYYIGPFVANLEKFECPYGLKLACLSKAPDALHDAIVSYGQRLIWQFANPQLHPVQ